MKFFNDKDKDDMSFPAAVTVIRPVERSFLICSLGFCANLSHIHRDARSLPSDIQADIFSFLMQSSIPRSTYLLFEGTTMG